MITLKIGNEEFEVKPRRASGGKLTGWRTVLGGSRHGVPFVSVEIDECHRYGCAATLMGKKHGPCDCGAEHMLRNLARDAEVPFDLGGRHPDAVEMRKPAGKTASEVIRVAPDCVPLAEAEGWKLREVEQ